MHYYSLHMEREKRFLIAMLKTSYNSPSIIEYEIETPVKLVVYFTILPVSKPTVTLGCGKIYISYFSVDFQCL